MPSLKVAPKSKVLEEMLRHTSWTVSHAIALTDQSREAEAEVEWLRAGERESDVACMLEAEGHDLEAAVHYVSAASCYAKVKQYANAVARLRSAMSFSLRDHFRCDVESLLKRWLPKAKKQLRQQARIQAVLSS